MKKIIFLVFAIMSFAASATDVNVTMATRIPQWKEGMSASVVAPSGLRTPLVAMKETSHVVTTDTEADGKTVLVPAVSKSGISLELMPEPVSEGKTKIAVYGTIFAEKGRSVSVHETFIADHGKDVDVPVRVGGDDVLLTFRVN